jgi:DNA-binding response OmpR family regulator
MANGIALKRPTELISAKRCVNELAYKVLIIEDELNIRRYLQLSLKNAGYTVIEAENGEEGYKKAEWERPHIVLLDVGLPGIDGFSVCKQLRSLDKDMGIVMLTAKSLMEDKSEGFSAGADDYCVKPCDVREIKMRIDALIRRMGLEDAKDEPLPLMQGIYKLDLVAHEFYNDEVLVNLSPTEFALIHLLMDNPGRAFSRDELLNRIWGLNYEGDPKVVDVFIRRVRVKTEDSQGNNPIETVWGKGYRWHLNEATTGRISAHETQKYSK